MSSTVLDAGVRQEDQKRRVGWLAHCWSLFLHLRGFSVSLAAGQTLTYWSLYQPRSAWHKAHTQLILMNGWVDR